MKAVPTPATIYNRQHAPADAPDTNMADKLFLSLWFPSFAEEEMMPRTLSVLRQFPFSPQCPGVSSVAVHPVNWAEPTLLEQRFRPGLDPEAAVAMAADLAHTDYAYVFEAFWDLWIPASAGEPALVPMEVKFIAHGLDFEEHIYQQAGHLQVDFGLDTPFLGEEDDLAPAAGQRFRANVQRLVVFSNAVEKNCGITGRALWSESDENLAQKLIARLQKIQ